MFIYIQTSLHTFHLIQLSYLLRNLTSSDIINSIVNFMKIKFQIKWQRKH